VTDPTGPDAGLLRVARGGSWLSEARWARPANRDFDDPGKRSAVLGFRLAIRQGILAQVG